MKKFFWILVAAGLGIGSIGVIDRLLYGHIHAAYGSIIPWGLWVALYIYFVGLSAGAFLVSSLVYVFRIKQFEPLGRLSVFTALITLLVALLFIWFDLGHMERAWRVLLTPNFHSMMAWMVWLYTAYFILLLLEAYFLVFAKNMTMVRILGTIGVPLAIMFHGGVGALFGVIAARPYWHSGMYPIIFLVSALASGGALITAISLFVHDGWRKYQDAILSVGRLVLCFLLVDILFNISEILVGLYGAIPHHVNPYLTVMKGPFWWVFWYVQLGIGMVVPVILLSLPSIRATKIGLATAVICILFGFIGVRLNIVIPALAAEEITGLVSAYRSARLSTYYFPSLMEWLVSIFICSLGMLLFVLGQKFFPLEAKEEI